MKGLIFNIQRYSIHDGKGIRTIVFFKGCPLYCPWCSNPESQSFEIEKVKIEGKCIKCSSCSLDIDECPSGAITEFGRYMTVYEVIEEITKDMIFYRTSDGGVTLSGGEPLTQSRFVLELLKELKTLGIHTAIETSGNTEHKVVVEVSKYTDLFLYDLKIMDEKKSKELLGADIKLIKHNLESLVEGKKCVIPRVPLVPGYTLDDDNLNLIIEFVKRLNLKEIHLLPFHQYGSNKYEYLGKGYKLKDIAVPSRELVDKVKNKFEKAGFKAVVGG